MVRYSPHHEFPLSSSISIALHILVIGLLIIGAIILKSLNYEGPADKKPVQMEVDQVKDEQGGGGGSLTGVPGGNGPGGGGSEDDELPVGSTDPDNHYDVTGKETATQLKEVREKNAVDLSDVKVDDEAKRLVTEGGRNVDQLLRIKKLRDKINADLAAAPKGKGGSGNGGGMGNGQGPGNGAGAGPGTGNSDPGKRAKRSLRWTMIFNTRDGQDYRRQLQTFGAILAVPDPKDPDGYLLIEDLKNPKAAAGDVAKIERLYWVDDKPSSVHSLAQALGVPPPPHFIVFFPHDFEEKLLRLELGYRNKREEEITETRFEVRWVNGTYEPYVISQR